MEEIIYKEYKLGTILNVITGINKLSTWSELKDILVFFNGGSFPDYQLPKIALDARNKIIFNNREFIDVDILGLNELMVKSNDKQSALNKWLIEQEKIFGSTIFISRQGKIKEMNLDEGKSLKNIDAPKQLVKKNKVSV